MIGPFPNTSKYYAQLPALALQFCAAAALGLAIVVCLSVVWSVAVFLQALVGEPPRPSSNARRHISQAAEGAS